MALLSQSQQPARGGVGMRNALLSDEALPDEVCHIRSHAVLVSVIAELFKILARNGTELPKLSERPNFRRSDAVGPAPKVVCLARFDTALRFNSRYAFGCQPSIILRVTPRSLSPRRVGAVRLTVTRSPEQRAEAMRQGGYISMVAGHLSSTAKAASLGRSTFLTPL